ncbi:uncharacterized protein [Drosophila tropicalis]|uniref:uncharacterized protein n=1 Tax=Drosophila tropicalis TaxID=46794 RepID=UPI0035AB6C59
MAGNSMDSTKDIEILMNQLNHQRRQQHPQQSSNSTANAKYASSAATAGSTAIRMCPSSANKTNYNNYNNNNNNNNNNSKQFNELCMKAQAGQKLMIIMRGPPGCGKSTLADNLLRQSHLLDKQSQHQQLTAKDFIFSSDDYFFNNRQVYQFNPNQLPDAHAWNRKRVQEKASNGWSPIIVDNTNIMIWEMQTYVQIAIQYGYLIELLEPQTTWSKSASKLAQKNIHQVPRENIQRMLERFEKTTVPELIRSIKNTKYTVPLPQLRKQPPLLALPAAPPPAAPPTPTPTSATTTTPTIGTTSSNTINSSATTIVANEENISPNSSCFKLNANATSWLPYEQNATNYWSQNDSQVAPIPEIFPPLSSKLNKSSSTLNETSILDLLRNDEEKKQTDDDETAISSLLQRHSLDCPNEASGFVILRQMYANKHVTGLWDLYVKCNGDVDWAVDILIKESELNAESTQDYEDDGLSPDEFQCDCSNLATGIDGFVVATTTEDDVMAATATPLPIQSSAAAPKMMPKLQRQQRCRRNNGSMANTNTKELQLQIQNCFTLGDDQYSEHTRKIRDIRNGILDLSLPLPTAMIANAPGGGGSATMETQTQPTQDDDDNEDPEENTLLEIDLGETLIKQLRTHCHYEGEMLPPEQELPHTKVFIPRHLVKQLHMLWMESVFNQLEEQRQQTKRDDEQFARLLQNPKYAEYTESPSNVNELLDMEMALTIYQSELLAEKQAAEQRQQQRPNDIATHLTKMKLCEKFPDIAKNTMLEIFESTGCNYGKTVELIDSEVKSELSGAELYKQVVLESEKLNAQVARGENQPQQQQQQQQSRSRSSSSSNRATSVLSEDAKRAALRDFEETRNMAAHHSQLKAECYLKAKQAIQQGNGSVALYYSEIAQLHKTKIDAFNHRAANSIIEVHKHTQNNPDLLDLHYLHTDEAISCLDIFLDHHITGLRNTTRVYKHVFIITGRGLHSANGVSTIKNKVKTRLGERRLRWQEVNPGLLRVKVFSASRHAKNI